MTGILKINFIFIQRVITISVTPAQATLIEVNTFMNILQNKCSASTYIYKCGSKLRTCFALVVTES